MKQSPFLFALCIALLFSLNLHAQQHDKAKDDQIKQLAKELSVSKKTAIEVVTVLDAYKVGAKAIAAEKNISSTELRAKLDILIDEKYKKLSKLLSKQQLQKILPSTELTK